MWRALVDGQPRLAFVTDTPAYCRACGGQVYAVTRRAGTQPYWAHKPGQIELVGCEARTGPMTEWHFNWQSRRVDLDCVEVWNDGRTADAVTPSGLVVEFQHSTIPVEEVTGREKHWRSGIWVVDGTDGELRMGPLGGQYRFDWDGLPRLTQVAKWPMWIDLGDRGMIEVDYIGSSSSGLGWRVPEPVFTQFVLNGDRLSIMRATAQMARPLPKVATPDHETTPSHCSICGNRLLLIRPGRTICARH